MLLPGARVTAGRIERRMIFTTDAEIRCLESELQ